MHKRLIGILVTTAVVVAACTGSSSPAAPSSSPAAPSSSPAAPPAGSAAVEFSGKLTLWSYLPADFPLLVQQSNAFMAKHPGVTVEHVFVPFQDLSARLIAAAATSTGPDMIMGNAADATALRDAGAIVDETDCVSSWPTASDLKSVGVFKLDGRTYGVLPYLNLVGLWYNKAILDKYGLQPPTTIDQLEASLAKITAGGDGGLLLTATPDWPGAWQAYPFFSAFGVFFPNVDKPETEQVFARLASWADKGWVPRDVVTLPQGDQWKKFLTGKYAFSVNTAVHSKDGPGDKGLITFPYGLAAMPSGTSPGQVYVNGEAAMIGKFGKNPAMACAYFGETWLSQEGALRTLNVSGLLPMLQSLDKNDAVTSNPVVRVYASEAAAAAPPPAGAAFTASNTIWGAAVSNAFAGGKSPAEISSNAVSAVKQALGQ